MRFDKVILAGSGKIACDCVRYLTSILTSDKIYVLESADNALSMLERICRKENIEYDKKTGKELGQSLLNQAMGKKLLIISANNRYIFKPEIIHMAGVEIINFHYALLPHYRGQNIPTWVIYNKERVTGITWHYVTEEVDHGSIIIQKEIAIEDSTTAFEITRKGMLLGIEAFKEFIGEMLEHPYEGKEVVYSETEEVYKNSKLPENGILKLDNPIEDIIRLLHSYDYGGMEVIPKLRLEYLKNWYSVEKYDERMLSPSESRKMEWRDNVLTISDHDKEVSINLKRV